VGGLDVEGATERKGVCPDDHQVEQQVLDVKYSDWE
jgi:hypothetical protein